MGNGTGDGSGWSNYVKSPVKVLDNVVAASAGYSHSLAAKSDGTLWAWGDGSVGQLGDGGCGKEADNYNYVVSRPKKIAGVSDVAAVSAGINHSLVMTKDGTVYAFGDNTLGELGNGGAFDVGVYLRCAQTTPVRIMTGAASIAAGDELSFVVKKDGTLWGFGNNSHGGVGNGYAYDTVWDNGYYKSLCVAKPVEIMKNVLQATAGYSGRGMAVTRDGQLYVWGNNERSCLTTDSRVLQKKSTLVGPLFGDTCVPSPLLVSSGWRVSSNDITVIVNGEVLTDLDQPPVIVSGRTLLPLRAIGEALGAAAEWDDTYKRAQIYTDTVVVKLTLNETAAYINGKKVFTDVPAQIISGRMMVPVRFVAEALGCTADWEGETRTVILERQAAKLMVTSNNSMGGYGVNCFLLRQNGFVRVQACVPGTLRPVEDETKYTISTDSRYLTVDKYGTLTSTGTAVHGTEVTLKRADGTVVDTMTVYVPGPNSRYPIASNMDTENVYKLNGKLFYKTLSSEKSTSGYDVKLRVYNSALVPMSVDVYSEDSVLLGSYIIPAHWTDTGVASGVAIGFQQLTEIPDMFSENYFSTIDYTITDLQLSIPAGGYAYVTIPGEANLAYGTAVLNFALRSFLTLTKLAATDTKVDEKTVGSITKSIAKALGDKGMADFCKYAAKQNLTSDDAAKIMALFTDKVVNNPSIDFEGILTSSLTYLSVSVVEDAVTTYLGIKGLTDAIEALGDSLQLYVMAKDLYQCSERAKENDARELLIFCPGRW